MKIQWGFSRCYPNLTHFPQLNTKILHDICQDLVLNLIDPETFYIQQIKSFGKVTPLTSSLHHKTGKELAHLILSDCYHELPSAFWGTPLLKGASIIHNQPSKFSSLLDSSRSIMFLTSITPGTRERN